MNNNNNKQQQHEDYARTAGSAGKREDEGPPVMDSVSPIMLLVFVIVLVAFLGLLGWGAIIVFGM